MGNYIADVNDIVGTTIGVLEVLQYVGRRESKQKQRKYVHYYLVRCTKCGAIKEMQRSSLQEPKVASLNACNMCDKHKARLMAATSRRVDSTPNTNNHTTGIKHYSITWYYNTYRHDIIIHIDGKAYHVARYKSNSPGCIPCMVAIADEMHEVLAAGGKEAFFEWYETNKARFPK